MIENKNHIFIPPAGLINLSRKDQKKYKKYKNSNLYNTCYINSSIQCLFRLDEFINKISNCSGGKLVEATKNLIKDMDNGRKILSVSEIKEAMSEYDEKYVGIKPEDANEFISDYLDALLEETQIKDNNINNEIIINNACDENFLHFLNRFYKNGKSFISDLFYGILRTENKCKQCNFSFSIKYHSFNIMDFPLNNNLKNKNDSFEIEDLITKFISEKEVLNTRCKKCKNIIYTKTVFHKLPKYFILYFERNGTNYIENDINYLKTINFNYFLEKKESKNNCYKLKGIIFYSFLEDNNTHYSSCCLIGNKWFYFDDNHYVSSEEIIEYKEDYPIILFYEKKD